MRFNKIKIFRHKCLTYQMIDSLHSPLLESDGYAFSTSPGGKLATATEEIPKMIQIYYRYIFNTLLIMLGASCAS